LTKRAAFLAALAVALTGCGAMSTRVPHGPVDLDGIQADSRPYFWVGESFGGLDLTYAERYNGRFASFIYGTCETSGGLFAEGGCAPPPEIQNVRCSDGSVTVAIFGRHRLAARAAKALRAFNRAARKSGRPLVTFDHSILC